MATIAGTMLLEKQTDSPAPPPFLLGKPCKEVPAIFLPLTGERRRKREAREKLAGIICESCPTKTECRDFARANASIGFWGGEGDIGREKWWASVGLERIEYPPRSFTVVTKEDAEEFREKVAARKEKNKESA